MELQRAAQQLRRGEINKSEYDLMVEARLPYSDMKEVPKPLSISEAKEAIHGTSRKEKVGIASKIFDEGDKVGTRIDIKASEGGKYVVTIHDKSDNLIKGGAGKSMAHEPAVHLKNVRFGSDATQALDIAAGRAKGTIARMEGEWQDTGVDDAYKMAKANLDNPEWVQIGMNPLRQSQFYVRADGTPVIGAEEILQIGKFVLARGVDYGTPEEIQKRQQTDYGTAYMPRDVGEQPEKMGININDSTQDYTGQILRGEKTIETRDNPTSLAPYVGKEVGIVRTGKGKATLVGKATVGAPKLYSNEQEFQSDYEQHRVGPESEHYIKPGQQKWGFPLTNVQSLEESPVESRGNVARKVSFMPREVEGDTGANETQEPMEHRDPIVQASIPETVDNAATLENAFGIAGGQQWRKGRDLKVALQQNVKNEAAKAGVDVSVPSPQTTEYLVRVGKKDALMALKQNANAIGWYDIKTRLALRIMSLMHPEIMTDENARLAFTWALATTSNGLKVGKNFQLAERAYRKYKETGVMPNDVGTGTAKNAINESLDLFNTLSKEWGTDNLRQFMQTPFTVGEISALSKELKPGGEHADTVVKGSAILGPKIGNGFFSNFYGNFDALTMDRWLVRTWGRWTGTLIEDDPINSANQRNRLVQSVKAMTPEQVAAMSELVGKDVTATEPDELAVAIQKASMKPEKRAQMPDEFRLSGNGLAKYLDGQKEAPAGPHERTYIRSVFNQILDELHQMPEYKDLTMADLQAVLWYGEKRLYETAKVKVDDENDPEGYSDEEAPDYANAAAEVALANGVSQRKINNAIALENGLTTTAQSGTETPGGSQGEQGAAGGFTEKQKLGFFQTRAVARIRSSRSGDEKQSFSYSGGSGSGSERVRVLKSLGIRYKSEWKGGSALKRIFKNSKVDAPSYMEIDTSDDASVQKFADLITESKKSTPFGSSVYVYPPEEYSKMKLFIAKDGLSGVAVKPDGDIVSVFSHSDSKAGRAAMELAISAGGKKLDCFDTILPAYYSAHGFRAVSRLKWDDSQAPEGWDKNTYAKHNNGQPDVVFMVYDPSYFGQYSKKQGKYATSYDQAVNMQKLASNKAQREASAKPVETTE